MVMAVVEGLHCCARVHCKLRTATWQMNNCLPALFMRILRLELLLRKCSAQSRTDCSESNSKCRSSSLPWLELGESKISFTTSCPFFMSLTVRYKSAPTRAKLQCWLDTCTPVRLYPLRCYLSRAMRAQSQHQCRKNILL